MVRIGVHYRIGVRGYRGGWSGLHRYERFSGDVHVGRSALQLAALAGAAELPEVRPQIFLTIAEKQAAGRIWEAPGNGQRFRVLVGCGGSIADKRYPETMLGQAIERLSDWASDAGLAIDILLSGGPGDIARAHQIVERAPDVVRSIAGETTLRITFAVTAQAHLVVTNASMLLHAAAAFRRPTLAILGGANADAVSHDLAWGYEPPYSSIGPESKAGWPDADKVASAMCALVAEISAETV